MKSTRVDEEAVVQRRGRRARQTVRRLSAIAAIVLLLFPAGCSVARKAGFAGVGVPRYEQIRIVYDRCDEQGVLLGDWNRNEDELPSDEDPQHTAGDDTARVRLTIEYPPPDGNPKLARATLERLPAAESSVATGALKSFAGYVTSGVRKLLPGEPEQAATPGVEIGRYEFPREELDLLLADLSRSGFFESESRPGTRTRLSVQIDRRQTGKGWTPEQRLDHFIKQIDYDSRRVDLAAGITASRTPYPRSSTNSHSRRSRGSACRGGR